MTKTATDAKNSGLMTEVEAFELTEIMRQKYAAFIAERYFELSASKDATGVHVKLILRNGSGTFYYPVEARLANLAHEMTAKEAVLFLVDYVDAYYEEYFREGGEVYLPIDWTEFEHEGLPVQLKGQILNLAVEAMADEWLAKGELTADLTSVEKRPPGEPLH